VTIRSKNWRDAKLVKETTKNLFFVMKLKETCETLEPLLWSREGLC
jgi:hypothetical protein